MLMFVLNVYWFSMLLFLITCDMLSTSQNTKKTIYITLEIHVVVTEKGKGSRIQCIKALY